MHEYRAGVFQVLCCLAMVIGVAAHSAFAAAGGFDFCLKSEEAFAAGQNNLAVKVWFGFAIPRLK